MFNFRNGTALAVQQDMYLQKYLAGGRLTSREIYDMEQNLWVATASVLAPGNLVIRQWALIDLFKGSAKSMIRILELMDILTYKTTNGYKIWSEGYSYYSYTMDVLKVWVERFRSIYDLSVIIDFIYKIDQGFIVTSYFRDGLWYPAPVGDLRDFPLSSDLQIPHVMRTILVGNVIFNYVENEGLIWYSIKGRPLGCNTHIPKDDYTVRIIGGIPLYFKFYEGYNKKYKSSWDEFRDTFDVKRLRSIPF